LVSEIVPLPSMKKGHGLFAYGEDRSWTVSPWLCEWGASPGSTVSAPFIEMCMQFPAVLVTFSIQL
jgi:hypothetical protein